MSCACTLYALSAATLGWQVDAIFVMQHPLDSGSPCNLSFKTHSSPQHGHFLSWPVDPDHDVLILPTQVNPPFFVGTGVLLLLFLLSRFLQRFPPWRSDGSKT